MRDYDLILAANRKNFLPDIVCFPKQGNDNFFLSPHVLLHTQAM